MARTASEHRVQGMTRPRLDRGDEGEAGRALAHPVLQCWHSCRPCRPLSIRPVRRLIELHPSGFTGAPRRGKRREKPCCGVTHIRDGATDSSHLGSEPPQIAEQPARRQGLRPVVGPEVRVGPTVDENDASAKEVGGIRQHETHPVGQLPRRGGTARRPAAGAGRRRPRRCAACQPIPEADPLIAYVPVQISVPAGRPDTETLATTRRGASPCVQFRCAWGDSVGRQVVVAARSTSRSCSPRRSSS